MKQESLYLTEEEKNLLVDLLFEQNYAVEILACQLSDIETGLRTTDIMQYQKITALYARLKGAGY
ncbi:antirepressor AbbA [Bacillus sp. 165]|uniref:antirepressor AbbA n=1 Tax=Bacillus sp. 165 TaxID=1529117 RepID=UPI001ADD39BD|nr:antirepressor AbbA [Bacillus sp. 165]